MLKQPSSNKPHETKKQYCEISKNTSENTFCIRIPFLIFHIGILGNKLFFCSGSGIAGGDIRPVHKYGKRSQEKTLQRIEYFPDEKDK